MDLVEQTLEELEPYILELNKEQLKEGRTSDGGYMPLYSDNSLKLKQSQNKSIFSGRVALYDEGDFWKKMFISVYKGKIEFGSDDSKAEMLETEYGNLIYGVDRPNMKLLAERANPILYKKIIDFLKTA